MPLFSNTRISGIFGLPTLISRRKRCESSFPSHIVLIVSPQMFPLQYPVGTRLYALCSALTPLSQLPVIKAEPKPMAIKTEPKPSMIETESQPPMVKHEAVEGCVPSRKRSGTLTVLREIAPKKIKTDPENPSTALVDVKLPPLVEAIRNDLTDLQGKINHLQPQLDRARRKSGKTTDQLTREKNLTSQLIALYEQKKELTEMIPAVSAPAHPIAGPSYSCRNGFVDAFAEPRQPVQPPTAPVPVPSGSSLPLNSIKNEPMDTDSDNDNHAAPLAPDMDHFHPFDDKSQMLVDDTNLGLDIFHYNAAKADEWVEFLTLYFSPANVSV